MLRRVALAIIAALAIAGCTSTVVLGTLTADAGSNDLSHPIVDLADGGFPFDGFDGGFDGFDGFTLVDLAH